MFDLGCIGAAKLIQKIGGTVALPSCGTMHTLYGASCGCVARMTDYHAAALQVQDQIRDTYKKQYLALPNGREKIALKNALIMAYKATGMTEAEARKVNAVSVFPAGAGRKRQEIL